MASIFTFFNIFFFFNPAGIALIFAVDRPFDMCRTVVNISVDAVVGVIMNRDRELVPTIVEDGVTI